MLINLAVINDLIFVKSLIIMNQCDILIFQRHSKTPAVIDEYRKREGIMFVLIERIGRNACVCVCVFDHSYFVCMFCL